MIPVESGGRRLKAIYEAPFRGGRPPLGLVIFAHGSGSSRLSPRNQWVAREFRNRGMATLLVDLLSEEEALDRSLVFDTRLLADRLIRIARWTHRELKRDPLGPRSFAFFGASTGAAAALLAAPFLEDLPLVGVLSRGGRPDLAGARNLRRVRLPTLFIVGALDEGVVELNQIAAHEIPGSEIVLIPGATHLFEETGTLDEVSEIAGTWFSRKFKSATEDLGRVAA
jgi:putative phosphoribosyl transferase